MFSLIVAIGNNNEIGKDNKLLWNIPEDLKNFRKITTGNTIIMGRKTYESIGRPLPNRKNIVLTRNIEKKLVNPTSDEIEIYNSFDEVIKKYSKIEEEIFILGGEQIYKEALEKNIVDKLYISHIDYNNIEADAYFPKIDYNKWEKIYENKYEKWKFCIYIKKKEM